MVVSDHVPNAASRREWSAVAGKAAEPHQSFREHDGIIGAELHMALLPKENRELKSSGTGRTRTHRRSSPAW